MIAVEAVTIDAPPPPGTTQEGNELINALNKV